MPGLSLSLHCTLSAYPVLYRFPVGKCLIRNGVPPTIDAYKCINRRLLTEGLYDMYAYSIGLHSSLTGSFRFIVLMQVMTWELSFGSCAQRSPVGLPSFEERHVAHRPTRRRFHIFTVSFARLWYSNLYCVFWGYFMCIEVWPYPYLASSRIKSNGHVVCRSSLNSRLEGHCLWRRVYGFLLPWNKLLNIANSGADSNHVGKDFEVGPFSAIFTSLRQKWRLLIHGYLLKPDAVQRMIFASRMAWL